ncbi:MAG: hypothetical protein C0506_07000 [Anaerolinea sp.]|nr:hypothetical protein [Anaerolinea sp.]
MPEAPLAYFLAFRTYGTWLPGDDRGSTDRHRHAPGEPFLPKDDFRRGFAERAMKHHSYVLTDEGRQLVESSIRQSCALRGWELMALNVRTNHVHVLVAAGGGPERVLVSLKAWATRDLRGRASQGRTKRYGPATGAPDMSGTSEA